MTPFSSVAMLEKLALLKMASWSAPVFRSVSFLRTSVNFSIAASASRMDSSGIGIGWLCSQILSDHRSYFTEVNRLGHERKGADPSARSGHCFLGRGSSE